MKFNIGDKVIGNSKATARYGTTTEGWTGTVTNVDTNCFFAKADKNGTNFHLHYEYFDLLKPNSKIVITRDGKTTLARLYDGEKVTRSAEAFCAAVDTYDFTTGANLAYDRLMRPAEQKATIEDKPIESIGGGLVWRDDIGRWVPKSKLKPEPQDKPKFKAGDKAKVIANTCGHHMRIGDIVTLTDNTHVHASIADLPAWHYKERSPGFISERDMEPYTEPAEPAKAPEVVKLYCVKDYEPGHWCTKGKIYEIDADGGITHDDGWVEIDFLPFMRRGGRIYGDGTEWKKYLVPLVPRPAKAGEWVLIVSPRYTSSEKDYTKGAIYKVLDPYCSGVCINNDHGRRTNVYHSEYLTLDGYDGRYEPQEPKYWSGKVVCVKKANDFLTAGKVYTFKNGKSSDDNGATLPCFGYIRSIEHLNEELWSDFIEYKGEAT